MADSTVTHSIDENMRMMASTFLEKLGKEFQLRGTNVYLLGQGLLSHKDHQECQSKGNEMVDIGTQMIQLGQKILGNKEVDPEQMKDYVQEWSIKVR
ncbi:MAG TPA: hypothetical protein VMW10_06780 [Alphaproteobacteria bacterium]|nr:hypothetical protein [Alphaproteobacteria bacterium]